MREVSAQKIGAALKGFESNKSAFDKRIFINPPVVEKLKSFNDSLSDKEGKLTNAEVFSLCKILLDGQIDSYVETGPLIADLAVSIGYDFYLCARAIYQCRPDSLDACLASINDLSNEDLRQLTKAINGYYSRDSVAGSAAVKLFFQDIMRSSTTKSNAVNEFVYSHDHVDDDVCYFLIKRCLDFKIRPELLPLLYIRDYQNQGRYERLAKTCDRTTLLWRFALCIDCLIPYEPEPTPDEIMTTFINLLQRRIISNDMLSVILDHPNRAILINSIANSYRELGRLTPLDEGKGLGKIMHSFEMRVLNTYFLDVFPKVNEVFLRIKQEHPVPSAKLFGALFSLRCKGLLTNEILTLLNFFDIVSDLSMLSARVDDFCRRVEMLLKKYPDDFKTAKAHLQLIQYCESFVQNTKSSNSFLFTLPKDVRVLIAMLALGRELVDMFTTTRNVFHLISPSAQLENVQSSSTSSSTAANSAIVIAPDAAAMVHKGSVDSSSSALSATSAATTATTTTGTAYTSSTRPTDSLSAFFPSAVSTMHRFSDRIEKILSPANSSHTSGLRRGH